MRTNFFFQPGCTAKFGFKYFEFQMQITKSNPFNNKYGSIYGTVHDSGIGIEVFDHSIKWGSGLTIDFDIFKKKKTERNRANSDPDKILSNVKCN